MDTIDTRLLEIQAKKSEEEVKAEEARKKRNEEIKQQYMKNQREKQEAMAAQVLR